MTLKDLTKLIKKLEDKEKEINKKREILLIDFVSKLDMENLSQVEVYAETDRLLDRALNFILLRKEQIRSMIREYNE